MGKEAYSLVRVLLRMLNHSSPLYTQAYISHGAHGTWNGTLMDSMWSDYTKIFVILVEILTYVHEIVEVYQRPHRSSPFVGPKATHFQACHIDDASFGPYNKLQSFGLAQ
jgi:hypothetical protein